MLEIHELKKSYGRQLVLDGITARFERGQVIGVIGPNGCGKTTLIKSILGLVTPDSGEILFDGISVKNHAEYRDRIGYMPQIGKYPDTMTIGQLFSMLMEIRGENHRDKDTELMESFKLNEAMNKTLGSLSGGTIQKVSAACAYLFDPDMLVLDEPTAGLDPVATEILKDKIASDAHKKVTLITSHILSDLEELATHILFLNNHKIFVFESTDKLRESHNGEKLGKVIARLMTEKREVFNV